MSVLALIDTNVILDVWFQRKPFFEASVRVLDAVERGSISGLVCASSVTDLYYLGARELGASAMRSRIEALTSLLGIAAVHGGHIRSALGSEISDFEDAVLEASAVESGATCIITRNVADFERSRIPAWEPEIFLHGIGSSL